MKQWKLVLVALLSVLLVCTCMSALAGEATPTPIVHDATHATRTIYVTDPSCFTPGVAKIECTVEGCTWSMETTVAAFGRHEYVIEKQVPATCTENGSISYVCVRCKDCTKPTVVLPAIGHKFAAVPTTSTASTCTEKGVEVYDCLNGCGTTKRVEKAMLPHNYGEWNYNGPKAVKPTCTTAGTKSRQCVMCKNWDYAKADATGHKLVKSSESVAPNCTEDGREVTICANEGCTYRAEKVLPKLGHQWTDIIATPASCLTAGWMNRECTRVGCDVYENHYKTIPATGHKGKWVVKEAATAKKDGTKELRCTNINPDTGRTCNALLDVKSYKYAEMMYNNTITGFGPCTRDLIGGKTWNRVTPVDLSVDGTYTYDLVASNKYVVGTLVVTVANGTVTVNYELNANQIKITEETLTLYANLEALKNGTGLTATVGTPIDIVANFGEDTKVIVAFAAKADYNAVGAGVASFKADEAKLAALIALID